MLLAFIFGTVIGFVLAIPPGPVAVAILKAALDDEKVRGFKMGLGAVVMDIIYVGVIMVAMSALRDWFVTFSSENPAAEVTFQAVCVVALTGYGIMSLRRKSQAPPPIKAPLNKKSSIIERIKSHGPFFIGAGISMANLANPTFIPSLWAASTALLATNIFAATISNGIIFAFGFGLGTFCWIYVFIRLIMHYRDRMSQKFIARIHQFAGVTMIGFGAVLGYNVVTSARWAEVVRLLLAI